MADRMRYREWLLPGIVPSVVITALLAVFAIAVGAALGAVVGWVGFLGALVAVGTFVAASSPRILVDDQEIQVGQARLPRCAIGRVEALDAEQARLARGPQADARDYLVLRTLAAAGAVRITLDDARDPHPHWLVTSRHPERLRAALQ